MHSKINEIKKNEGSPKVIKNVFSNNEINKFLKLYEQLPTTVHNKKQNVIKKRWLKEYGKELEELGQTEVQSSVIGKKVMDSLQGLDKIAYVRYASVYTNFKEVGQFGEYIEELDGKSKK